MEKKVGFIGLGAMGLPMAQNLLKSGFSLLVYNRTKEKANPLIEQGAHFSGTATELAAHCDAIVTMVSHDKALEEVLEGPSGLLRSMKKPSLHISMSTVSPEMTAYWEKKHQQMGIDFVAAPVSGRPERARAGTLWIFLGGQDKAKEAATPLLKAMSSKIFDLGEHASQAALFKLCSNFMILGFLELFSEASTLLEKGGIPLEKSAEIWGASLFESPIFKAYMPILCRQMFQEAGFALDLGLKDMRLLQTCADKALVPLPILAQLHEKLLTSMNLGREKYDWSAITLLNRERAGL